MEDRVAEFTVKTAPPDTLPWVAVMVAVATVTAVARPLLSTVATAVFDEIQVTCVVISKLVPSEYVPTAANCRATPMGTCGLAGMIEMETSWAVDPPPEPPHPTITRKKQAEE
jgi:ABC-type iron transport system FetAB permease component